MGSGANGKSTLLSFKTVNGKEKTAGAKKAAAKAAKAAKGFKTVNGKEKTAGMNAIPILQH